MREREDTRETERERTEAERREGREKIRERQARGREEKERDRATHLPFSPGYLGIYTDYDLSVVPILYPNISGPSKNEIHSTFRLICNPI